MPCQSEYELETLTGFSFLSCSVDLTHTAVESMVVSDALKSGGTTSSRRIWTPDPILTSICGFIVI